MTIAESSYLAGIIDGEGSIMLIRTHAGKFASPNISIASVSLELLVWVKEVTGVGQVKSKKNYKPDKHQDSFSYVAKYNDALMILDAIYPFLVIDKKKKRAHFIINNYKRLTKRNGRYSKNELYEKEAFYNAFMAL